MSLRLTLTHRDLMSLVRGCVGAHRLMKRWSTRL
jgi:hypothetical protein